MSKKPQKPQNQNIPKKSQIVDQQNQPFLRTIAKRVRNINKKLTEIDELKKKGDLKPEQVEKVNRRGEYEQQRSRLEGIADFYREAYAENVEQYRNYQLQELDALANAVAILRGTANFKEADRLAEVNRALTESSNLSLTESARNISQVLRRFANDYKLKKSIEAFVGENQTAQQPEQKTEQQPVQQETVQQTKVEETKPEVQNVVSQAPVVQAPVEPQAPVQEQKVEQTQPVSQEATIEQKPAETQGGEQKPVQGGEKRQTRGGNRGEYRGRNNNNRGPRQNRGPREYREPREPREPRGEGQQEGGERRRYNNPNRQRPNYRPKNEEQNVESDSDSSLERQQAMRNFRKDEIRKLEDEGFQVVGKPKPKAKQGQKEWHEHTHGKKNLRHHHEAN